MKHYLLTLCIFLSFFFTTCSNSEPEEIDSEKMKIDYLGAHTVDTNTDFTFIVTSEYKKQIVIYVEAFTTFNEKLISTPYTLKQGEKKEIKLKKNNVITSNHYIKSYRIKQYKINSVPLQRPVF